MNREGAGFAERYGPWATVLGAGQGIGLAFAEEIAARGVNVQLVDVREDLLEHAVKRVEARGAEARPAVVDLAADGVGDALRRASAELDLGLAVYTAMLSLVGPFHDEALERHERAVRVGCLGVAAAAHVYGALLRERGRGGLILTSSLAGFQGTGWVAGYSACKAFDLALAEALWWELRPAGVDVMALVPGTTDTPGMMDGHPRIARDAMQSAEDVAVEALDALGQQPLLIPGEANRAIRAALEKLPRTQLVELISEQTRKLYED